MIKDLMDGNPIRGRKGWREGRTGAEVEEVLGLSIVCSRAARCRAGKVKSPNLVKIMLSSEDVVLIQQITGLYIMSCKWRESMLRRAAMNSLLSDSMNLWKTFVCTCFRFLLHRSNSARKPTYVSLCSDINREIIEFQNIFTLEDVFLKGQFSVNKD